MTKDNIREYLIAKGRGLVTAQGAAFLTARKPVSYTTSDAADDT